MPEIILLIKIFITFFTIGLFTIGGGQAMIPLIENAVVGNNWLTFEQFQNFVTVSESTPGPIVINIATFVGQSQFTGILSVVGSLTATTAVVLPSFVIILIIAKLMDKFTKNRYVRNALKGIRPFIIGIIMVAAAKFFYTSSGLNNLIELVKSELMSVPDSNFFSRVIIGINSLITVLDYRAIIIMVVSFVLLRFKKTSHPLVVIGISAVLGIIFYGLLG